MKKKYYLYGRHFNTRLELNDNNSRTLCKFQMYNMRTFSQEKNRTLGRVTAMKKILFNKHGVLNFP